MNRDPECIFCKIIAGEIPGDAVYEDEDLLAFRDINPQAPTHILIIPKEHRARLTDYNATDADLLGRMLLAAKTVAAADGHDEYRTVINCGSQGGQVVWHLHLHVLAGRQLSGQLG